ncbi:MAG: FixH family protein [Rhodocyclaceae bacterium]
MKSTLHPGRDAGPWYRQPWPWLLMVLPVTAIVGGAVTLWLAERSNDGLVADDYYKQGLAINRSLAREDRARALELSARLRLVAGAVEVAVRAREGVVLPEELYLDLAHATRPGMDRRVTLKRDAALYRGALDALAPGKWHLGIEDGARTWRLAGVIVVPGQSSASFAVH